jgi:PAS domain S-box-containing protein
MSEPSLTLPDGFAGPVLDALDDLLFTFDERGRFRQWNRAVVEVTGYDDDELASMSPADFFEAGDAERVSAAVAEVFETGRARVEAPVVTKAGERIPHEFRAVRVTDDTGETQGFCGIGRDISERRAVLDRMTDAFFAVDSEWRLTYVNDRAGEVLSAAMAEEVHTSEMPGTHLWEAIPAAVDTAFYDRYHEAMRTQEAVSFREHYAPLDAWFEVRAYPSETGLSVFFRDVTEQQRHRERIESRERVLRELYDVIADADRSFDEQVGALMDVGRDVLGTGYATLSRIEGETYVFEAVRSPDDEVSAGDRVPLSSTNCERAVATERTLVLEDVAADAPDLAERAGHTEWGIACYLGAPVRVDGEVYGTFCFYDETPRAQPFSEWEVTLVDLMAQWVSYELERRQVNERLARKNERLEEFASIVSHDLRNPLNVLQGSIDIAERTGDPEQFAACRRAADRMEALIEDVLTLSRQGEAVADASAVRLAGLAECCWTNVETDGATLRVETDRVVVADESRLGQVLENLARNAVEHGARRASARDARGDAVEHGSTSPSSQARKDAVEHGSTSDRAKPDDADEHDPDGVTVTVGDLDDGFYVEDDGPGIPPGERDRVFESGYSTAATGTGFGLAIVERIVEAHGWRIDVTEGSEGGARFEIRGVEFA